MRIISLYRRAEPDRIDLPVFAGEDPEWWFRPRAISPRDGSEYMPELRGVELVVSSMRGQDTTVVGDSPEPGVWRVRPTAAQVTGARAWALHGIDGERRHTVYGHGALAPQVVR